MRKKWLPRLAARCPERNLQNWLREPGSLTARCENLCREFRVRLLSYRLEESLFGGRHGRRWVREVMLECDGRPVIFAHTELVSRPRGRLRLWLAGLGSRSLGSLLFAYPGFKRGAIEYCRLDSRHPLFARALAAAELGDCTQPLWARRSLHCLGKQGVVVTEVFLPEILLLGMEKTPRMA